MKALPFLRGWEVGNALILKLLTDPADAQTQEDMWYRVKYLCCDNEGITTHRKLWDRERRKQTDSRPVKNCPKCAPNRQQRLDQERNSPPVDGLYDLRGQWWPYLRGPMGPRWGNQNPLVRGNHEV